MNTYLYTVQSFSQLHRDFKDHDLFIACGREGRPKEMLTNAFSKREAPSSNSSNDSLITGQAALRKPKKIRRPNIPDYESNPSFVRSVSPVTPQPARGNSHPNIATRCRIPKPRTKAIIKAGRSVTPQFSKPEGVGKKKTQRLGKRLDHSVDVIKVDIHGRRREFYPPTLSDGNIDDGERPDKKLKLDWVYGYRGHDARNNLYVLPSNELLYYVAAVAIVYDKQRELQRHYTGHNEDISSMALHPNETYVATAQLAGETADTAAHIRVWDVRSLSTYAIIGLGVFQVGLSSLDFSAESEGEYLMAIDEGERHVMSVWNWQDEKMLAKTTLTNAPKHSLDDEEDTSIETVIWGCFHPQDDTTLVTYGEEHIHFWKIFWDSRSKTAKILRDKKSGFFKEDPPKFVTAIAFSANGDVITGDSSGRILVWSRDSADAYVINTRCSESMRRAHRKTVFALCMLEDGTLLSGAGDEIKAWDSSDKYRNIRDRTIPESAGYVRTLVPQSLLTADDTLFVGTTKNIVLEGSLQHKFRAVVQGHVEEVWTAAISPSEHAFVTAGHDMMVCKWSAVSHKMLWKVYVDSACWASAYHPEGHTVVIGTETGQVIVLNANNGSQLASFNASHEKIQTVQYSPDGAMLAIGCHDNTIYVFDVLEKRRSYRRHGQGFLRGHKNFVLNLDWSRDSGFLRSVSGDCDTLFWNVNSMQQEKPAKSLRDVDWHTHNCILGYHVIGAWSNLVEGEDLSCTARSHYRDYLAVGDTEGAVRLYKYPCAAHKPEYYEKKHYSSNVTSVGFLFDDSYVISTGGVDAGVMQFAVVEPLTPR
ncbi:echinoderm microtubule-associated protein-like 2 isoform X2 [Lingula anatina]|uniref:Echinoderm microtubule-associated protein-like 2 isoform X2 n=1 Tax=Lingula anatina TaxID=7574 RepID=A0A1S3JKU9_LINAN|nr:echinoderm microtubule-associated protein-like 2 isoform X2 [Lingula anatina]|eukprot:XP_013411002.1 echinoderm microtubule-associated protein-like 2 isoform X2 [Lingula anatina]